MLIDRFEHLKESKPARRYLGCSSIGHPCERKLWRTYHIGHQEEISFVKGRIFERGNLEERRIFHAISKLADVFVETTQVSFNQGSLKGHADAIINVDGERFILEIKTMAQTYFLKIKREGAEKSHPEYFAQCQAYMGLSHIPKALLLVSNKNTEELYEEQIDFKEDFFEGLLSKAERIHKRADEPLGLTSYSKPSYHCTFCPYFQHCWERKEFPGGSQTPTEKRLRGFTYPTSNPLHYSKGMKK